MGGLFQEVNNVSSFIPELLIKLMTLSPASKGICLWKSLVFSLFFLQHWMFCKCFKSAGLPFELNTSQKEKRFSDADEGFPET